MTLGVFPNFFVSHIIAHLKKLAVEIDDFSYTAFDHFFFRSRNPLATLVVSSS